MEKGEKPKNNTSIIKHVGYNKVINDAWQKSNDTTQ